MPRPRRIYEWNSNIVKVESRSKVYFDYAETRTYIWARTSTYSKNSWDSYRFWWNLAAERPIMPEAQGRMKPANYRHYFSLVPKFCSQQENLFNNAFMFNAIEQGKCLLIMKYLCYIMCNWKKKSSLHWKITRIIRLFFQ